MSRPGYVPMELTSAEIKLILRLRQLRRIGETRMFLVTTNPITLSVLGDLELLDNVYASGSRVIGSEL